MILQVFFIVVVIYKLIVGRFDKENQMMTLLCMKQFISICVRKEKKNSHIQQIPVLLPIVMQIFSYFRFANLCK